MVSKVIKISIQNYEWLMQIAARLQTEQKRMITFDDALSSIRKARISDIAGGWKLSDKEADDFMKSIRKGWKSWK